MQYCEAMKCWNIWISSSNGNRTQCSVGPEFDWSVGLNRWNWVDFKSYIVLTAMWRTRITEGEEWKWTSVTPGYHNTTLRNYHTYRDDLKLAERWHKRPWLRSIDKLMARDGDTRQQTATFLNLRNTVAIYNSLHPQSGFSLSYIHSNIHT